METSTERFLRQLREQNAAIAAQEARKKEQVPPDPVRVKREQERREKYGTPRARTQPAGKYKRPNTDPS